MTPAVTGNTAWLQHFPREYRGRNGHFFYHAVRSGADTPRKVCSLVYREISGRLKEGGLPGEQGLTFHEVLRWLADDKEGALALAQYCLDWEQATPAERQARKEREAAAGKREWMSQQPASQAQLDYLKKLGHTGAVTSKLEASDLIEKLKK